MSGGVFMTCLTRLPHTLQRRKLARQPWSGKVLMITHIFDNTKRMNGWFWTRLAVVIWASYQRELAVAIQIPLLAGQNCLEPGKRCSGKLQISRLPVFAGAFTFVLCSQLLTPPSLSALTGFRSSLFVPLQLTTR
jgi:hypothetical protein